MLQRAEYSPRVLVLEQGRAERHYWRDIWAYRELFAILAWRDVAVRYKQTVVGVLWAVIRPFLTMIVFTVIFGRLAKLPTEGSAPYPVMVFAGMLPWFLFSTILGGVLEQSRLQLQPYRQGLFPADHHPGVLGRRRPGRFRDQSGDPRRVDALVRLLAGLAGAVATGLRRPWRCWRASDLGC